MFLNTSEDVIELLVQILILVQMLMHVQMYDHWTHLLYLTCKVVNITLLKKITSPLYLFQYHKYRWYLIQATWKIINF